MRGKNQPVMIDWSERFPEAKAVQYCSKCSCPVVIAPGAMDAHEARVHTPRLVSQQEVRKWVREW